MVGGSVSLRHFARQFGSAGGSSQILHAGDREADITILRTTDRVGWLFVVRVSKELAAPDWLHRVIARIDLVMGGDS